MLLDRFQSERRLVGLHHISAKRTWQPNRARFAWGQRTTCCRIFNIPRPNDTATQCQRR
jgi:hypothetical protein